MWWEEYNSEEAFVDYSENYHIERIESDLIPF